MRTYKMTSVRTEDERQINEDMDKNIREVVFFHKYVHIMEKYF